jgi:hypothetical protein
MKNIIIPEERELLMPPTGDPRVAAVGKIAYL